MSAEEIISGKELFHREILDQPPGRFESIPPSPYREFHYTVQCLSDDTAELINLLSQATESYLGHLTQDELASVAQWYSERYANYSPKGAKE